MYIPPAAVLYWVTLSVLGVKDHKIVKINYLFYKIFLILKFVNLLTIMCIFVLVPIFVLFPLADVQAIDSSWKQVGSYLLAALGGLIVLRLFLYIYEYLRALTLHTKYR
jgi:hypothetical protein